MYEGLDDYLAGLPRTYYCTGGVCPSDSELQLRFLNEDHQRDELLLLVDAIESRTENKDDQARIAISLVQNIPYDKVAADTDNLENRYPYEVLFDNKGVCEEKSRLLAFLLREFGYGAVLFSYERENHMAVGIKCPEQYSLSNMGYCFIETTNPSIITDNMGQYREIGYLRSDPTRIVINDGESFASVSREYNDAKRLEELIWTASTKAGYLDSGEYEEWQKLVTKYGIVPT
ncbi:MAG: hypothetical protein NT157_06825 [Candidatus Micrarchaeota archaeon]|nr:hypothetical protein [Candidatus Micrarchaeota archaeon]